MVEVSNLQRRIVYTRLHNIMNEQEKINLGDLVRFRMNKNQFGISTYTYGTVVKWIGVCPPVVEVLSTSGKRIYVAVSNLFKYSE